MRWIEPIKVSKLMISAFAYLPTGMCFSWMQLRKFTMSVLILPSTKKKKLLSDLMCCQYMSPYHYCSEVPPGTIIIPDIILKKDFIIEFRI
jgi:hypothetical protein